MFEIYSPGEKRKWDSKQKRCYHRLNSLLLFWESHQYQLLRIDLTGSNESDRLRLRINYILLRRKVEKDFGFDNIETFVVETNEGNGVLHMVWAWKAKAGFRNKGFYINQMWLSKEWMKLHKASVVWVKKYDINSGTSRKRVSRYFVVQYVAGQNEFVRYSYSWHRTLGFSLVGYWRLFRNYWLDYAKSDYGEMIAMWELFMEGRRLPDIVRGPGNWFMTVDELRGQKF